MKDETLVRFLRNLTGRRVNAIFIFGDIILDLQRRGQTGVYARIAHGVWTVTRLKIARQVALRLPPHLRKYDLKDGHYLAVGTLLHGYPSERIEAGEVAAAIARFEQAAARYLALAQAKKFSVEKLEECIVEAQEGRAKLLTKMFRARSKSLLKLLRAIVESPALPSNDELEAELSSFAVQTAEIQTALRGRLAREEKVEEGESGESTSVVAPWWWWRMRLTSAVLRPAWSQGVLALATLITIAATTDGFATIFFASEFSHLSLPARGAQATVAPVFTLMPPPRTAPVIPPSAATITLVEDEAKEREQERRSRREGRLEAVYPIRFETATAPRGLKP